MGADELQLHSFLHLLGRVAQSVQRLATDWTVRGSNPGGSEIFRTCADRPWSPPSLLYNGYPLFPGGKERPGGDSDPSPASSAVVKKGQSYTSTPPMGRTACTEPQCLYKGDLYLYLSPQYQIEVKTKFQQGNLARRDQCEGLRLVRKLETPQKKVSQFLSYLILKTGMAKVWSGRQQLDIESHMASVKTGEIYNQESDSELLK